MDMTFSCVYDMIYTNIKDNGGDDLSDHDRVLQYLDEHNGVIQTKEVRSLGIDTNILLRMEDKGVIERLAHGLYMDASHFEDPFYVAQYRCPKGIISMDTALYLHQMTDRNPTKISMTIPSGSNSVLLKQPSLYRFFYLNRERWLLGQIVILTPFGNPVRVYDLERTICDCIRKIDDLDRDEAVSAIKAFMKRPDVNNQKLLDYSDVFHIRNQVWQYLEVLR